MRTTLSILTVAAAFAASPALAQVGVGVGGQVNTGVGVSVDPGRTVGDVTRTLDRTVDRADRTVNRTLDRNLRVATRADVRTGATIRDTNGNTIGTVARVQGGTAVVVRGGRTLHVPLASLYRGTTGLVTSLPAASLRARANANGSVRN